MAIEVLYPRVTEAILRADLLADLGAPGAAQAYLDVSLLEERIADELPATDLEGEIARRGAVRAAGVAGEHGRARELAERYLAEEGTSPELRAEITALLAEPADELAAHDPRASTRYGYAEILRVTRALVEESYPFPVAC